MPDKWARYIVNPAQVNTDTTAGGSPSNSLAQGYSNPPNGGAVTSVDTPQPDRWAQYIVPNPQPTPQQPPAPQPIPQTPKPQASWGVMSVAPNPSMWERMKDTVANSAIGHSLQQEMPKVAGALGLAPTESQNSPTYQQHAQQLLAPEYLAPNNPKTAVGRVGKGALGALGQFTSGKNLATTAGIAATGGLLAPVAGAGGALGFAGRVGQGALKYGLGAMGARGMAQSGKQAYGLYKQGDTAGAEQAAGAMIPNAVMMLPGAAEPMRAVGERMQDAGEGLINHTIGATKADFNRGLNIGRGYFNNKPGFFSGHGPSLSMQSIANKLSATNDRLNSQLDQPVNQFSASGGLIPLEAGKQAILGPANQLRSVITGPGGSGDTAALDRYLDTYNNFWGTAEKRGGFAANEYLNAKRNVAKNTGWSDPSQAGMKQLRQQTAGAMSGVLGDAVPEMRTLNQQWRDTYAGANRAQDRALTGQNSLSKMLNPIKVGTSLAAGIAGGMHGGIPEAASAAIPLLADTVPVRTTVASGLFYGGKGLARAGDALSNLFTPSTVLPGSDEPIVNGVSEQQRNHNNPVQGISPYREDILNDPYGPGLPGRGQNLRTAGGGVLQGQRLLLPAPAKQPDFSYSSTNVPPDFTNPQGIPLGSNGTGGVLANRGPLQLRPTTRGLALPAPKPPSLVQQRLNEFSSQKAQQLAEIAARLFSKPK